MKETEKTAFFSNRKGYRHEFKYVIDPIQLESLRERLPVVLSGDPYAGPAGVYEVRSLYFDDYRNSCYKENEDGSILLTEEAAKAKIAVTVAGEPAEHVLCKVENGIITLRNTKGTVLMFR